MVNSASREKMFTAINAFVAQMIAGSYDAIVSIFNNMKVKRADAAAGILAKTTGFASDTQREKLLNLDTSVLAESSFNSALERNLSLMFKLLKLDYQKYVVGNAIIRYWEKVIADNVFDLTEQQMLAARNLAKIQIDWIKNNINLQDLETQRNKNHADIKKAANKPEVKALLTTSS